MRIETQTRGEYIPLELQTRKLQGHLTITDVSFMGGRFHVETRKPLTSSRNSVLVLGALGLSAETAGDITYRSVETIRSHRCKLYRSLETHNMEQSVSRSFDLNLLQVVRPIDLALKKPLARRQREVLVCAAQGMAVDETGIALGISPDTVSSHRSVLLEKLHVPNMVAGVLVGYMTHVLEPKFTTEMTTIEVPLVPVLALADEDTVSEL